MKTVNKITVIDKILAYLFFVGECEYQDLRNLNYDYITNRYISESNNTFKKKMSYLRREQYIEVTSEGNKTTPKNTVKIAPKGIRYLRLKYDYFERNREYRGDKLPAYSTTNSGNEQDRALRLKNAIAFFSAGGVHTLPAEKPHLSDLIYGDEKDTRKYKVGCIEYICPDPEKALKDGIFYGKKEITDLMKAEGGGDDVMRRSRLLGLVFTPVQIYSVYHCRNKLMKQNQSSEKYAKDYIKELLSRSPFFSELPINAIMLGTMSLTDGVASYTTGFVNGEVYNENSLYSDEAKRAMSFFTAKSSGYNEFYYLLLSTEKQSLENLNILLKSTSPQRKNALTRAMEDSGKFSSVNNDLFAGISSEDNKYVYAGLVPDLCEISRLRGLNILFDIVCKKEYLEGISRSVCRRAGEFYDTHFTKQAVKRYNTYGFPVREQDEEEDFIPTNRRANEGIKLNKKTVRILREYELETGVVFKSQNLNQLIYDIFARRLSEKKGKISEEKNKV